ncbi:hypothetical protein GOODEAATRI_034234 [Goodea atripinnis]|uniref:Uncharacterized protein n=1 Tax=Goodea atripinnis TaxID=208336 RepID=A0ABV0MQX6_9TELE
MSSIPTTVPSRPLTKLLISCWKISGADLIPNGRGLNQKLPIGVMNVVSFWQLGSNEICQNSLEASKMEKTLALANLVHIFDFPKHIFC